MRVRVRFKELGVDYVSGARMLELGLGSSARALRLCLKRSHV